MHSEIPRIVPDTADQRVTMYRVSWAGYEATAALRGESAVPRVTYLDGTMELMSPSPDHERIRFYLGHLIFAYALERDIDLSGYGSWTLREAPKTAGLEPDECFIIGSDQSAQRPDLAIEVNWTSGGINKLEIYQRLKVPEVWIWQNGNITVYVLMGDRYRESLSSCVLPGIVLSELVSFLSYPTAMQAVRAYRAALTVEP